MLRYFEFDVDDKSGEVRLRKVVDLSAYLQAIKSERQELGKGFSRGRNLRKIGSIPLDVLIAHGIDIHDDNAIRKFLREHPEFRCSEGEI